MGFLKPNIPAPPPIPEPMPLPDAPKDSDKDVKDAGKDQVAKTKKKKGRTSTILTGMMGDDSEATLGRKTLLG